MDYEKLIKTALEYRNRAYSPYSKFKVGAAVLFESGKIYGGCNIENASFGAYRNFSYYISAENVGNATTWGVPTSIPFELNDFFLLLTLFNQPLADEFQDRIWEVVRIEYPNQYTSLEDFFNQIIDVIAVKAN